MFGSVRTNEWDYENDFLTAKWHREIIGYQIAFARKYKWIKHVQVCNVIYLSNIGNDNYASWGRRGVSNMTHMTS